MQKTTNHHNNNKKQTKRCSDRCQEGDDLVTRFFFGGGADLVSVLIQEGDQEGYVATDEGQDEESLREDGTTVLFDEVVGHSFLPHELVGVYMRFSEIEGVGAHENNN